MNFDIQYFEGSERQPNKLGRPTSLTSQPGAVGESLLFFGSAQRHGELELMLSRLFLFYGEGG